MTRRANPLDGRFGAGLPRINDGSFLFLQHMISKMQPVKKGGSRIAIVCNGALCAWARIRQPYVTYWGMRA